MVLIPDDLDDVGDDVTASLDVDKITNSYFQSSNLICVVQSRARDCSSSDQYRSEDRDWSDLASSANLKMDVLQLSCCCASGELVRNRPSRRLAGKSKTALLLSRIDLNHHTVDFVAQSLAEALSRSDKPVHIVDALYSCMVRIDMETYRL